MIIDKFGCVIMEHSSWEGNRGDSCAETSRYAHLKMLLGDYKQNYNLGRFIELNGFLRHPELENFIDDKGNSWGVTDFTSDQMLPLYLSLRKNSDYVSTSLIENRIKDNWYRTGNGDLITPGLFAELKDSQVLRTTLLLGQQLIFKLPARWNDEKQGFEANENSVCDYLNYIHLVVYAPKWIRDLGPSPQKLYDAICKYYEPEINYKYSDQCLEMDIIELYRQVLEKYWS